MTNPDGPDITPGRPALEVDRLRSRLIGPGRLVSTVIVSERTRSTNLDLLSAAAGGAAEGAVVAAEFQTNGRGRFDRIWESPPRAGLMVSIVLRPTEVPSARWGWLPLLTGTALVAAVQAHLPVERAAEVQLKWPNDLLIGADARKAAGILAQAGEGFVVVGIGVNVDHAADELPGPQASSLRLQFGAEVDRTELLITLLDELATRYSRWRDAGGDPGVSGLRADYEAVCATLGSAVQVSGGETDLIGRAVAVDVAGALQIETRDGVRTISAGDIVHVRPLAR